MRKTIEFATEDGTVMRGWIHTDSDRAAASGPGIVGRVRGARDTEPVVRRGLILAGWRQ